ncbi:MAG: hypothetical protein GWM90_24970, partial [Gemmatimonadetes bacterium]|nr:hypothetical protein [Gemmatimonadota bacterium]NIR39671.1 hypothetical protein [Actinomycetota bacterium]NIX24925.1 hypothetical protein [Actinomycetota bacterium]NIX47210.1 hypothetical protein [Gemmatimonadota bacterium]
RGRPLYVFRDVPLSRGDHHVAVTFEAMIPDDFDAGDQQLVYRWEGSVRLGRGEIALVTLDDAASRLVRAGPG